MAFQKTLRRCVCCRQRRLSAASLAQPPATPSGESRRTSANINRWKTSNKLTVNSTHLSLANASLEASNGNLTVGRLSSSSKRNSCV